MAFLETHVFSQALEVAVSTMVVNATGQRRKEKTKLYYSCMISVMDVISKRTTYSMPILNK